MKLHQAEQLLVISLNNYHAIAAAYGVEAATGAMDHLIEAARRHLGRIDLHRIAGSQILLTARYALMQCLPAEWLADRLSEDLGGEPFRFEDDLILLSVSVGQAFAGEGQEAKARARLALSSLQQTQVIVRRGEVALYREDMAAAAALLQWVQDGEAALCWRPVASPKDGSVILYHEAVLLRVADTGQSSDCAASYAAMERLGLAHLLDRLLVRAVLRELESDPAACLSVAISPQSLSLNLHGEGAGWTDLMDRLRRNPALARRLVIEISDTSGMACFRDAFAFIRTLRRFGLRTSVARFGSGHASIEQLRTLAPDMVKLDSPFLHTAYHSERNRTRLNQLLDLARTLCPDVIIDGVESPWHLQLAVEEGAAWVTGSHLGRPSQRRGRPVMRADGHMTRRPRAQSIISVPSRHFCAHAKAPQSLPLGLAVHHEAHAGSTILDSV